MLRSQVIVSNHLLCKLLSFILLFNLHFRPLAKYNSLQDKNLAGYFGNTKMKKHLVKSGLVRKKSDFSLLLCLFASPASPLCFL